MSYFTGIDQPKVEWPSCCCFIYIIFYGTQNENLWKR